MSGMDRRDAVKLMALAPIATALEWKLADVDQASALARAAIERNTFVPRFFTPHEYQTVRLLVDLIIPADDRSGSATDAGVPEFMDFIMIDMPTRQTPMRGGLAWLDLECQERFDKTFLAASEAQRAEVLDDISTYGEIKPGLSHGQTFFRSFRDLTASGFWTSKMGIKDLGYIGNTVVPEWTGCPAEALTQLGLPEE